MKTLLKRFFWLLCIAVSGCETSHDPTQDKLIFSYNQSSGISSLDPAFARVQGNIWAVKQLFNTLIDLDSSLQPIPALAKSWEVSADGLKYTFTLRPGLRFHPHPCLGDDLLMRASDVVYSLERLRDPNLAAPGSWLMKPVDGVEALNDSLVEITLHQAFPPFLSTLSMAYASVVPQKGVECLGNAFAQEPIGSGPFRFHRWLWNEKLVFRKNPDYFERDANGQSLPYLDAVAIRFLPDKQAEYLELLKGDIDMISGLDPSYVHDILDEEGKLSNVYQSRLQMAKGPYLNTEYLGIFQDSVNGEAHALMDVRLRRAFQMAFDRRAMLKYLRRGVGIAAEGGLIPQGLPGHFRSSREDIYQPDSARQWVAQWKKEHPQQSPQVRIHTTAAYLDLCEYIQSALNRVGFEAEIELMPAALLREGMANGKLQVFRASWIADYPDAQNYLSLFFSENKAPNGPNYTHFSHADFDGLYRQSLTYPELKDRVHYYEQLDSLSMHEQVLIPLYYDEAIRFFRRGWRGLKPNPLNMLELKAVYWSETSATTGK